MTRRMRIEVLGFPACPNTPAMEQVVRAAAAEVGAGAGPGPGPGPGAEVEVTAVDQTALAADDARRRWPAPTVLVNGRELFGQSEPPARAMGCRLYPGGVPSREEVINALRAIG